MAEKLRELRGTAGSVCLVRALMIAKMMEVGRTVNGPPAGGSGPLVLGPLPNRRPPSPAPSAMTVARRDAVEHGLDVRRAATPLILEVEQTLTAEQSAVKRWRVAASRVCLVFINAAGAGRIEHHGRQGGTEAGRRSTVAARAQGLAATRTLAARWFRRRGTRHLRPGPAPARNLFRESGTITVACSLQRSGLSPGDRSTCTQYSGSSGGSVARRRSRCARSRRRRTTNSATTAKATTIQMTTDWAANVSQP